MILANQHARHMRADQTDKSNNADKGNGSRRKQTDPQKRSQPQSCYVEVKTLCPFFAEPQQGQIRALGFDAYLPEYKIERFNRRKRVAITMTLCLFPRTSSSKCGA